MTTISASMILVTLLLFLSALEACNQNSDCLTGVCINKSCTEIDPGFYCSQSKECKSFSYYGNEACSDSCGLKAFCSLSNETMRRGSKFCCKAILEGGECNPDLNACESNLGCYKDNDRFICKEKERKYWIVGMILAILSSCTVTFGYNLQRYSMRIEKKEYWYVGFAVYCFGNVGTFFAFNFAAQSLVAPLAGFGLVSNAIIAPIINKEVFSYKDAIGIFFIIVGSLLVMLFADKSETAYSLCELLHFYKKSETIILLCIIAALLIMMWIFSKIVEVFTENHFLYLMDPSTPPLVSPTDSNPVESEESDDTETTLFIKKKSYPSKSKRILTKLLHRNEYFTIRRNSPLVTILLPICYVSMSAIFASITTLLSKSCAELINVTIQGSNQFVYFFTYFFIITLIIGTVFQVYYINKGLKHYDTLLIVPFFHAVWTILTVISGGVYFGEFSKFTIQQSLAFTLGICFICLGAFFLAMRVKRNKRIE